MTNHDEHGILPYATVPSILFSWQKLLSLTADVHDHHHGNVVVSSTSFPSRSTELLWLLPGRSSSKTKPNDKTHTQKNKKYDHSQKQRLSFTIGKTLSLARSGKGAEEVGGGGCHGGYTMSWSRRRPLYFAAVRNNAGVGESEPWVKTSN